MLCRGIPVVGASGVAPENPVGWLYRVVRNRAINASRSHGRQVRREAAAATRGEPWFEPAEGDRLDAAAATDALRGLPVEQREVIVARVWGGLSFRGDRSAKRNVVEQGLPQLPAGAGGLRERLDASCSGKKSKAKT